MNGEESGDLAAAAPSPPSWSKPVVTGAGLVRWVRLESAASLGLGPRHWYAMVGADLDGTDAPEGVLLGYLSIDDPADFPQDDTRRPEDPIDRRVNTIWIHPAAQGKGLGKQLGTIAKEHRLFESHSLERTEAGTAWARSIGDEPPPATSVPDPVKFDRGAARVYRLLVDAEPDLTGLPLSD
ncbi:hypothetical protein ABZS29_38360 [Kribbella sp. NPDC005582]|uniref:hypothetical protein n=1 Tax=Kribbella sp. NPDC005582 TaxID=3156893 RepID=UPI00339E6011